MGSNGRPIYLNWKKQYLYKTLVGFWAVSKIFYKRISLVKKLFRLVSLKSFLSLHYIIDSKKQVGSDLGDLQSTRAGLSHSTCNEECPTLCSNQWRYYDGRNLQIDTSINVSCGKPFIIIM